MSDIFSKYRTNNQKTTTKSLDKEDIFSKYRTNNVSFETPVEQPTIQPTQTPTLTPQVQEAVKRVEKKITPLDVFASPSKLFTQNILKPILTVGQSLIKTGADVITKNKEKKEPLFDVFQRNIEEDYTIDKDINKAITKVAKTSVGTGITEGVQGSRIYSAIKTPIDIALGKKANDEDFYDVYQKNINELDTKERTFVGDVVYGIANEAPATITGVLLGMIPYAGKPLASSYFGLRSGQEQVSRTGEVYSLGNIAIDTVGDTLIGNSIESLFKKGGQALLKTGLFQTLKTMGKTGLVEGITEPSQSILKYANDYKNAKTKNEQKIVVDEAKDYVLNGGIILEALVGFGSGALIGAGADVMSQQQKKEVVSKINERNDNDFTPQQNEIRENFRKEVLNLLKENNNDIEKTVAMVSKETGIKPEITKEIVLEIRQDISPSSLAELREMITKEREIGQEDIAFQTKEISEEDLIQEAKQYKSGKDFYELSGRKINQALREKGIRGIEQVTKYWEEITGKKSEDTYGMSHRPQKMGPGFNIDEIGNAPNFYTNPEYFSHSNDGTYKESISALLKIKDKPEAEITVYRASPKNELNNGDWITLSKKYAKQESLSEGTPVHSFKVKAKDIQFAGDDINEFGYFPQEKQTTKPYKETGDLTTKILKDLEGKTTVSKQYILDATNRGELKQVEKDLIRDLVNREGDTVNVADFAKKVKAELLPLERESLGDRTGSTLYENISLPTELRGKVKNYDENLYRSPITTSAGSIHFSRAGGEPKYFGHTRIEDMADNKTRRVIEVQSDLYQKGNLEREMPDIKDFHSKDVKKERQFLLDWKKDLLKAEKYNTPNKDTDKLNEIRKRIKLLDSNPESYYKGGKDKLFQYNDPTAHFRMIREEIKKASQDGIEKLQFPTGETAMKIEGLGDTRAFRMDNPDPRGLTSMIDVTPNQLKVGLEVVNLGEGADADRWIITDVLGDGKFKAVPKEKLDDIRNYLELKLSDNDILDKNLFANKINEANKGKASKEFLERLENYRSNKLNSNQEQFDISGKIDTNNPIYKFYEKDVAKYLKNKYNAKPVTDELGVTWNEVEITPEMGGPVEAFQQKQTDTTEISFEEANKRLQSYLKRLRIKGLDIQLVNTIITPDNKEAYGVFFDDTISFTEFVKKTTADHELGHAVFRNLDKIPLFKNFDTDTLFKEAESKYNETSKSELEERIMEDYEVFVEQKEAKKATTFTGKILEFFTKLYRQMKLMFSNRSDLQAFYETLYEGVSFQDAQLQSQNRILDLIKDDVLDFREAFAFSRKKDISQNEIEAEFDLLFDTPTQEIEDGKMETLISDTLSQQPESITISKEEQEFMREMIKQDDTVELLIEEENEPNVQPKISLDKFFIEKDPMIFLTENTSLFEEGSIQKKAVEALEQVFYSAYAELDVYEPGGRIISYPGDYGSMLYKRLQAIGLNELNAEDRPLKYVKQARDAFRDGVRPKSEKAQFIYDHVIGKYFQNIPQELQIELAGILYVFEQRKLRSKKEMQKNIDTVKKVEEKSKLTNAQIKKLVADMVSGNAKKITTTDKKLFIEKIKNLNKGFKSGVKAGKQKGIVIGEKKGIVIGKTMEKSKNAILTEKAKREQQLEKLKQNILRRDLQEKVRITLDSIRKNIPPQERFKYMTALSRIAKTGSYKQYMEVLQDVAQRKEELDIAQGISTEKAKRRRLLGLLRHTHKLSPALLKDAKKILNIDTPYKDMTVGQLNKLVDEVLNRINFLQKNYPDLYEIDEKLTLNKAKQIGEMAVLEEETTTQEKAQGIISKALETAKKGVDEFTTIEKIKFIAPDIYNGIRQIEMNINFYTESVKQNVEQFRKNYDTLSDADKKTLDALLYSSEFDLAIEFLDSKNIDTKNLESIRDTLNDLYAKLTSVGVDVRYLKNYFPRYIKQELQENYSKFKKMLDSLQKKYGREATTEEKTNLTATFLRGFDSGMRILLSGGRFLESRLVNTINSPEILNLYESSPKSLEAYIEQAIKLYEERKFFNKLDPKLTQDIAEGDYNRAIESFVFRLEQEGALDYQKAEEVKKVLELYFMNVKQSQFTTFVNNLGASIGVGKLLSGVPQILEMTQYLFTNSLSSDIQGFMKNNNITLKDIGADSYFDAQEINLNKLVKTITTPMRVGDALSARAGLGILFQETRKQAKVKTEVNGKTIYGTPMIQEKFEMLFGKEEAQKYIKEFGELPATIKGTDLPYFARDVLNSEIRQYRVLSRLEKPPILIKNPLFGLFKTFTLKMLNAMATMGNNQIKFGIKNNDKAMVIKGLRRKMGLITALLIAGASATFIRDFLRGKDTEEPDEYVIQSLFQMLGLSYYNIENFARIGFLGNVVNAIFPAGISIPSQIIDKTIRDIKNRESIEDMRFLRDIPLVGDIAYLLQNL